MIIRTAQTEDTTTIAEFNINLARETENIELDPATVISGVTAVIEDAEKGFYLLAEIDTKVVGQLLITTEWSDWRNGYFWWIQSLFIVKEQRGQGVFRQLYDEVINRARKADNVCGIRLDVDRKNTFAQEVYRKLGMEQSNYLLFERYF